MGSRRRRFLSVTGACSLVALTGCSYLESVTAGTSSTQAQTAKLTSEDGDSDHAFGWSVALAGDGSTALVGAWRDEDPNGRRGGSAYVFEVE